MFAALFRAGCEGAGEGGSNIPYDGGDGAWSSGEAGAGGGGAAAGHMDGTRERPVPTIRERMMSCTFPVLNNNFPESVGDGSSDDDGSWANNGGDNHSLEEGVDDDEIGDAGAPSEQMDQRWEILPNIVVDDGGSGGDQSEIKKPPRLEDLHRDLYTNEEAILMEGGASNLRYNTKAAKSDYYPFRTLGELLFMQLCTKHQLTRVVAADILSMLRFEGSEPGEVFRTSDLDEVQAEHFVGRMRECMNLFEVYKRKVRCSPSTIAVAGLDSTAEVFDVPVNLILARDLQSQSSMKTFMENPGGERLARDEAIESNLSSRHVSCGPEKKLGNKRLGNMDGKCARSSPHHGYDGIKGKKGRTVYVHDLAMVDIGNGEIQPCSVLEVFWDVGKDLLAVTVRRLRGVEEIVDATGGTFHESDGLDGNKIKLLRLWEQEGENSEVDVRSTDVKDLLEIYTEREVADKLPTKGWIEGRRRSSIQPHACVGEGFVIED